MSRTLEQDRARFALKKVTEFPDKRDRAKFGTLIRKFPAMVLNNGLGQALAYLLADDAGRKKEPSYQLYLMLQEWLKNRRVYEGDDLISDLMNKDRNKYMHAQQEVLSLMTWTKKFADAYLPKGD